QGLSCSRLWDAGAAVAAGKGVVRHVDGRWRRESGRGRREVQRELAEVQLSGIVVLPGQVQSGRAIDWRSWAIHVGGQVTAFVIGSLLAELRCPRGAGQHLGAIESANVRANETSWTEKVVGRQVCGVGSRGPNAKFGVVVQIHAKTVGVEDVGASRIVGLGYRNAFRETAADTHIADDPAVGKPVVVHNGIACARSTVAAQGGEQSREVG